MSKAIPKLHTLLEQLRTLSGAALLAYDALGIVAELAEAVPGDTGAAFAPTIRGAQVQAQSLGVILLRIAALLEQVERLAPYLADRQEPPGPIQPPPLA